MRQPYGQETSLASLNQSYVFCSEQDVSNAVDNIKKGLEEEGMGDVASHVQAASSEKLTSRISAKAKRRAGYEHKIFLPSLTALDGTSEPKAFDYYRDILSH